ncbi:hypothetical protein NDU88_002253 [Pleurodeles waltl]|uniref:Uncharacterized protein n=1 Tax=Pleurodeles waltl TaxID=8319 RepID=A0AAV7WR41_PLEWA|nr:hypothetical protein NDU88_002253 [Pleurodeles waltl]
MESRRPCGASRGGLSVVKWRRPWTDRPVSSVCAPGSGDTLLSRVERTGGDIAPELRVEAENRGPATRGPEGFPLRTATCMQAAQASSGLVMGHNKSDKHGADGLAPCAQHAQSSSGVPQDLSVSAKLAAHTQKFDDILLSVQGVKSTLESKIDALCIDMGHLGKEHKTLKEHVASTDSEVTELLPPLATATQHVRDLQREVSCLHQRTEGQEGRARHNKIRVVGLPEQEETHNMDLYMEQWLAQTVLQSFFGKSAEGPG